ncbi:MAG: ABC transporter ATP-binding protein [Burkholderiaceae bacterium]|nr:ABC transporter ATP-binding protein [Burkholderiaceae bacterium]
MTVLTTMLELKGVAKYFGNLSAVDDLSASVAAQTITGLIGPNGAGKSTLFSLIAGELRPDCGEIRFLGRHIGEWAPHRIFQGGLARTFQIPRPFPRMSVLENMMVAPVQQSGERFWNNWIRPSRVRHEEIRARERAMHLLEFTGLTAKANELAGCLSGGQQKLLELARVLMNDPQMVLLDEPAAGVNASLLETLMEKIVELHRRGVTFLVIEHNMDLIMRLCTPILVMSQGRLIFEGDAGSVRCNPVVLDAYLGDAAA